jgi:hypothetical protein
MSVSASFDTSEPTLSPILYDRTCRPLLLLSYCDGAGGSMTFKQPRIVKSREHFMRAIEDEFSEFELKERAFRQAEWDERAAQLRLPIDLKTTDAHVYDAHICCSMPGSCVNAGLTKHR